MTLDAVGDVGSVVAIPMQVRRTGTTFRLTAPGRPRRGLRRDGRRRAFGAAAAATGVGELQLGEDVVAPPTHGAQLRGVFLGQGSGPPEPGASRLRASWTTGCTVCFPDAARLVQMPEIRMPEGQYFSLSGMIRANTGGQTRALLMRNRLLAQRAGIEPTILTFDAFRAIADTRAACASRVFSWTRCDCSTSSSGIASTASTSSNRSDRPLDVWTAYDARRRRPPGRHRAPDAVLNPRDRPGSDPGLPPSRRLGLCPRPGATANEQTPVTLVNSRGSPVARWPNAAGWHQQWIARADTARHEGVRHQRQPLRTGETSWGCKATSSTSST